MKTLDPQLEKNCWIRIRIETSGSETLVSTMSKGGNGQKLAAKRGKKSLVTSCKSRLKANKEVKL
jgi:hypothetical protein